MTLKKIKQNAIEQFAEKGYDGTSVKEITKLVGITAPALYAHFSSKEELFLNVFQEALSELVEKVKKAIINTENENCERVLYSIYRVYLNEVVSLNPKMMLILRNTMFPQEDLRDKIIYIVRESNKSSEDRVKEVFDKGMKEGTVVTKSAERYYRQFFKLITAHIFEVLAFNIVLSEEQIDAEWTEFWNAIKR
jgi:AcrR family transcriptional regulator